MFALPKLLPPPLSLILCLYGSKSNISESNVLFDNSDTAISLFLVSLPVIYYVSLSLSLSFSLSLCLSLSRSVSLSLALFLVCLPVLLYYDSLSIISFNLFVFLYFCHLLHLFSFVCFLWFFFSVCLIIRLFLYLNFLTLSPSLGF